jgi:hypothetical protein
MTKRFATMVFLVGACVAVLPSSRASAQGFAPSGGATFGGTGQVAITGDFEAHLHSGWELRLHPSLDYFIAQNVSIGGVLGFTYHSGSPSSNTIDLGARAGYNLNITGLVSFWPRVGIFFSRQSGRPSTNSTYLGIFAPFLVHLAPHFFVGVGPSFNLSLDGGGNSSGLDSVVGGYF